MGRVVRGTGHHMAKRIVILQGHPDLASHHLCHALADGYARGAKENGHAVEQIDVARLDFPFLRTKEDFEQGAVPQSLSHGQDLIRAADHLVIVYPLWLGDMPALLKAYLEQIFRPGFAFQYRERGFPVKGLKGKSARIIVTMGMPAIIYRWYFGAYSVKNLKRGILGFSGIGPVRTSLFGMVETASDGARRRWLEQMRLLGARAS